MSDFDFLKEFGKNLDHERPMQPAEADWERLAADMAVRERRKRRRRRLLFWALPVVLLGLFTLPVGLLWQARSRADLLQTDLLRTQRELAVKSTISITDTIYRTVVLQTLLPAGIEPVFSENKSKLLESNKTVEKSITNLLKNTSPEWTLPSNATNQSSALPKDNTQSPQNPENNLVAKQEIRVDTAAILVNTSTSVQISTPDTLQLKEGLSPLPLKNIPLSKSHQSSTFLPLSGQLAGTSAPLPVAFIHRLRPHHAAVGVTAGKYFPRNLDSVVWNIRTLGVRGQIGFGRHLRLLADVEHSSSNFRVNTSGLSNFHIPPITPPTPFDQLNHVGVEQSLWDFSLGLRYVFRPEKRLHLLIGANWIGEVQKETFRYEFRNLLTGEQRHASVPNLPATFQHGLQIGTGVEWVFARRFSLGLEGLYTRLPTALTPVLAKRWGVRAALTVGF